MQFSFSPKRVVSTRYLLHQLFCRLYGIIGMVIMIIVFLLLVIAYFILFNLLEEEKARTKALWINRMVGKYVIAALFTLKVETRGVEHLENRPYVIVSNHQSSLDIPLTSYLFPYQMQFLAKKKLKKIPLIGYVVRCVCVLVDRRDMRSRVRSFQRMAETLTVGKRSILIYPEGTRNRSEALLQEFHDGAFLLAIKTGTPIVPLTLDGMGDAYPPNKKVYIKLRKVKVYWDKPIETTGLTAKDIPTLKEKIRQQMIQHLDY